ncbi:hypothetical protein D8674_030882 [Pyrus ussuriensis x Pyrus communis]|uniref:Uncharacterized protein n=1 Tax=Pyrus ussuriensis x Pyrus communis TaxID=2448454 RepID=A0A5N5F2E0_9ROSA|nr:hypothetical protein D8674_030882 [Pyrus ussuriensis x Pyrus communis]
MTALERSSMSFRRQGSSGRIWEDRLPVFDQKPSRASFSGCRSDFEHHPNFDRKFQEREFVDHPHYPHANEASPNSKQEGKVVQRCFLSSFFGRCMGSPTAA